MSDAPEPGQTCISPMCLFTWPVPAAPVQWRSTLPSQWSIGVHGPADRPCVLPDVGPPDLDAVAGSCDSGTSTNMSKKLPAWIAGTAKSAILPKSGRNTPKSCDDIVPVIGPEAALSGFVHRTWKRTVPPLGCVCQSIVPGTGFRGVRPQSHVVAHSSTMPGRPPQSKRIAGQHVTGTGVAAVALMQIQPLHPAGTGFGASVTLSFS